MTLEDNVVLVTRGTDSFGQNFTEVVSLNKLISQVCQ